MKIKLLNEITIALSVRESRTYAKGDVIRVSSANGLSLIEMGKAASANANARVTREEPTQKVSTVAVAVDED